MIRSSILLATLFAPGWAFAQSPNADAPRITDITLFEAGLAEIGLDVDGQSSVDLMIPLKDIDDVLKSLIITGDFSSNPVIRLSGETPVEDAFMASPVQAESLHDIADILSSIRGTKVRLSGLGREAEGVVTGVSSSPSCTESGPCIREVTLMDPNGSITRFPLDSRKGGGGDISLKILDEKIVKAIAASLDALAQDSNASVRAVTIDLGEASPDAGLSYVIQAPMWKTAYRALLDDGEVSLQAWAVIENATPSAWEDISLTLSSGSPITLAASLHARQWGSRKAYKPEADVRSIVSADAAPLMMKSEAFAAPQGMRANAARSAAELSVAIDMSETMADSRFTFPEKISINPGEMISVPFLSRDLEAELLTVWSGRSGRATGSPDMILEISNDLPVRLPEGIMTIQSRESGYIGDAEFPILAPGGDAQVAFNEDKKIKIRETTSLDQVERNLSISRGVVTLIDEEIRKTTYALTAPGDKHRKIMVDHPFRETAKRSATGATGENIVVDQANRKVVRYSVEVDTEEEVSLIVEERLPLRRSVQIGGVDPATLLQWSSRAASDEDTEFLAVLSGLMRERAEVKNAIVKMDAERDELAKEQERVARMMKLMSEEDMLRDRYLETLESTEDRLEEITPNRQKAQNDLERLTGDISDMIEG